MASIGDTRAHSFSWPAAVVLAVLAAMLPLSPAAATDSSADRARESAVDRAAATLECTINGTPGDDVLVGGAGDDVICGGAGDDVLRGAGGDDVLRGGAGEDRLIGGPGEDYLQGGRHDDLLRAGSGDDALRGGRGNDRLNARDSDRFEDHVRCDEGNRDRAYADPGDRVSRTCELPVPTDPNAAPTDLSLSPSSVVENAPVGTLVGQLSVTDADVSDAHRFSLVAGPGSTDNASFAVDGTRLATAAVLDHEAGATRSVRLRVTDRAGASWEEAVTVSVTDADENTAPSAVDDRFATAEDTVLVLPVSGAGGPAANDVDAENELLTVTGVASPVGGTVAISGGSIRFTPTPDLCGTGAGRFDYTVSDGRGGTDVGLVAVDLTCVQDPAVATDDAATTTEDAAPAAVPVLAQRPRCRRRPAVDRLGDAARARHGGGHRWWHGCDVPSCC